jgi:ribosome-binding protein aMBF1 (putative translation factor)
MKKVEENNSKILSEILSTLTSEETEKTENRMLLAAKIEDALLSKRWKKTDLATALKKEPSVITKWLSGTHNFTVDTLWDIQRVLEINLINLEEKPKEQVIVLNLHTSVENVTEDCSFLDEYFYDYKTIPNTTVHYSGIIINKQIYQA